MKAFKPIKYRRVYLRARPTTTAAAASGSGTVNLEDESPSEAEAGGSETPLIGRTPLGALWWWNGSAWSQIAAMIALLFATLAANAADPLPKYVKTPLTTNSLATAATLLTAREFLGMGSAVSVIDHGAVPDDTGNDTTAFAAALAAGDTVLVPRGRYLIGGLTLASNKRLIGVGKPLLIYTNEGTFSFVIDTVTGASTNYTIQGLALEGPDVTDPVTSAPTVGETRGSIYGIKAQTWGPGRIIDCDIYGFSAPAIAAYVGAGLGGSDDKMPNLQVRGVKAWWNNVGFESNTGEYINIDDSQFWRNSTNAIKFAGNVYFTGCRFTDGHIGMYMSGDVSANHGHGSQVGCELNHNLLANVYATNMTYGDIFSGCQLWSEEIRLLNVSGFTFTGCMGSPNVIYASAGQNGNNTGHNLFSNSEFSVQPLLYLQSSGAAGVTNDWDYVDFRDCWIRGNSTTAIYPIGLKYGLVAYWPMNEHAGARRDKISGTELLESAASIYATNAPWSSFATLSPDRSASLADKSLYAPGSGMTLASGDSAWSVAFWAYLKDTTDQILVSKCNPATGVSQWLIGVTNVSGSAYFKADFFAADGSVAGATITTSSRLASVGWHHVTLTHATGTGTGKVTFRVNASGDYATAAGLSMAAVQADEDVPLRVGGLDDGTQTSDAYIRDLCIYKRVIPANEQYALFNGWRKRFGLGD